MSKFKAGDKVMCVCSAPGHPRGPESDTVYVVDSCGPSRVCASDDTEYIRLVDSPEDGWLTSRFELVESAPTVPTVNNNNPAYVERMDKFVNGAARTNDKDTSLVAAKKVKRVKIADVILDLLDRYTAGLTGQEIAERTGFRLNSVTPRFAQLSRGSAKIKDSGLRRSGQIVWVRA